MTSITATVPRAPAAAAPSRPVRTGGLREAPWVRAALGVAIGGLLVADLAVVLRERADAAAAGRTPAPVLRADVAREGATATSVPAAATFFDEITFSEAVAGSVSAAGAAPVVADDPAAPAVEVVVAAPGVPDAPARLVAPAAPATVPPAATPPRDTAPPARLPGLPPVPPVGDAGPAVSGLVESIPLVGPTLAPVVAPVVEPVVSEVVAPVVDASPSGDEPAGGSPVLDVVESVVEPATAPLARPRLLG